MSTRRFPALFQVIAAAFLLVAPGASNAAGPDGIDRQAAKRHFARGAELYRAGQYEDAIDAFEQALEAHPNPMIRYNLSLAHLKAGHVSDALSQAREAREAGGMPRSAGTRNDGRIRALETVLEARETAGALAEARAARDAEDNPLFGPQPESEADNGGGRTDVPEPAPSFGPAGWVGAGMTGLGGVGLGLAAVTNAGLKDEIASYRQAAERGDVETYRSAADTIDRRQTTGRVFLYSGLGLAAVGTSLFLYDLVGTPDAPAFSAGANLTVSPGPRSVHLRMTF